jgi:hypothetical protein
MNGGRIALLGSDSRFACAGGWLPARTFDRRGSFSEGETFSEELPKFEWFSTFRAWHKLE